MAIFDKMSFADSSDRVLVGVNWYDWGAGCGIAVFCIGVPHFLQNLAFGGFASMQTGLGQMTVVPGDDCVCEGGLLWRSNPHFLQNLAVGLFIVLHTGQLIKTP